MPPSGTLTTERAAARPWLSGPRRSLLARFSTAHGLMVLAGLLTFVLVVSATKGSDARITVAAARADLPAGAPIDPASFREVDLPADATLARATVRWDDLKIGQRVTARPIGAGELLRPSDLVTAGTNGSGQLRAMSIPAKRDRAAGGILRVGDRVDVIDVVDGVARWVVTGAQVIAVPAEPSSKGIVRDVGATYHVVVEVSSRQALALAESLTHDSVSVVRSTGAPPPFDAATPLTNANSTLSAPAAETAPAAPAPGS